MKYIFIFALSLVSWSAFSASSAETYVTNRGVVFTRVSHAQFGPAWQAPDGTVWSSCLGQFTNLGDEPAGSPYVTHSAATNACEKIGGQLPSLSDYIDLVSLFCDSPNDLISLTPQDAQDFSHLFADCPSADYMPLMFWTDTAFKDATAARFFGNADFPMDTFGDYEPGSSSLSVRCLGH
jgi:hypothetical protein